MGASQKEQKKSSWKRTRNSGVLGVVGRFYEEIAKVLTNGEDAPRRDDGDLLVWTKSGKCVGLEVKSGVSKMPLRIPVVQFNSHIQTNSTGFLCDDYSYMLFRYNSQQSRKEVKPGETRKDLTASMVKMGRGEEFLAERTTGCWIFPITVIQSILQDHNPTIANSFPTNKGEMIEFTKTLLRVVASNPSIALGQGWEVFRGHLSLIITIKGKLYPLTFPVIMFTHPDHPTVQLKGVTWENDTPE